MPATVNPAQSPEEQYDWVHIDDFSPGGYDGSNISTVDPVVSAPLGACNFRNTFCCSSITGGALGPLPAKTTSYPVSTVANIPGGAPYWLVAGFITTKQLVANGYEIVSVLEAFDGANTHLLTTSYVPAVPALNTISGATYTHAGSAGFFGAPYPAFTRMNVGGTPGPPPPGPVLVFPTSDDSTAAGGHLWVYPELLSPTSFVAQDIVGSAVTGQVICYGSRVITLVGVTYSWPAGSGILVNENFNYTDPPESSTYTNPQEIFAIEYPYGYGAWGTVSVGELLLVKKHGGGVILYGDIATPTSVIPVPGVQPTGDLVGRAYSTPIGLIYCCEKMGAWVWNGGNTSQKISKNLEDSFFDLAEKNSIPTNNYGFNCFHWQKWIMFSGNAMMDSETNGWWQLYPAKGNNQAGLTGQDIWWMDTTEFENQLIVSPLFCSNNTDPWATIFDNAVSSSTYQWQSLPIHVTKDADRVLDVREVTIRASSPDADTHSTVAVTIGSWSATSTLTIGVNPTTIRFNAAAEGLQDITLTLVASNSNSHSAPIIHSVDIGYQIRAKVAVNN
jgi:hypothetical protein